MNTAMNTAEMPRADVVIIFTKAMYTKNAIAEAKPIIDGNTVVVTLQNGLGNIEAIEEAIGGRRIIAGVTNYASDLLKPGEVELKGSGVTKMMALDPSVESAAEEIAGMLKSVGHNAELSDDVLIDIWEKVAFNAALNCVTAVTGLSVGGAGSLPESRKLLFDISSEIVAVAHAENVNADEAHVHDVIKSVFDPKMSGDHKTSMLQDRLLKRKTEIEAICGYAIGLAAEHGINTPLLKCMYALVRVIEENYESNCLS